MCNMSVSEAAKLMNKSPQFIRIGLQQGVFPWGYAVKLKEWTYYINREKLIEHEKMCM